MRWLRHMMLLAATVIAFVSAMPLHVSSQRVAGASQAPRRGRRRAPPSTSVGFPFHGRLLRGVRLEESSLVRYAGEYAPGGNFYGTSELVTLIERAAAHVARRVRTPAGQSIRLSVGELSRHGGGPISGHRSHQNGRDVDIAFYMRDAGGAPFDPFGFANFDRNGHGLPPNESLTFDDARNWELVSRLVSDADARVQYIFVANTLRERLLRTGRRRRASSRVLARADALLIQPAHGHPHRNHFHVRIYCPPGDRPRCEDREPFHPWYPGTPPGATPVPSTPSEGAPATVGATTQAPSATDNAAAAEAASD